MKKSFIVICAISFCLVLTVDAFAATIPVNVSRGLILQISAQSTTNSELFASLGVNLNDRLALGLEYANPSNYYTFKTRYSFAENIAAAISYSNRTPAAWNIDFRLKHDFDESLAVVGVVGYDGTYVNVTGQVEYWFMEELAGNIGFSYSQSLSSLILGGELVIDKIDIGLDCRLTANNLSQSQAVFFVAYKL